MKKLLFLVASIVVLAYPARAQQLPDSVYVKTGFITSIRSEHLDQERKLFIHLPVDYDSSQPFPLVILLDGEASFKAFASATELMNWQKLIPSCIVVGIPNVDRNLDYAPYLERVPNSGRAEKMIAFYKEELFPFLESRFNIGMKIIWGHSFLGFFTIYVMLEEPELFDAYLATSPVFRFLDQVFDPETMFDKVSDNEVRFYMSLGGEELVTEATRNFALKLESDAPDSLIWEFSVKPDKTHDSNAIIGYMDGLEFVFTGPRQKQD
ncbi:MAG TPA: alpha/beta hydrolase [Bacteroides sp.]|nr:alpha/beta hydrolase [Bacteroides sp.]